MVEKEPAEGAAEEALRRLRAADPAGTSEPDLPRLRAAVSARLADGVPPAAADRRPGGRWLSLAAAVVAAVLVGTAGFGLGRSTGSPDHSAAPPITLGSPATDTERPADGAEIFTDGETLVGTESAIWPAPGNPARTTFHPAGLSDERGTSTAWAFDATQSFGAERVGDLAEALGIGAEPELVDGVWQAGATDGSEPYLLVHADGQSAVSYHDPSTFRCIEPAPAEPDAATGGAAPAPCEPTNAGPALTAEAALERARELLEAGGHDPGSFELEVTGEDSVPTTSVLAHQVLEGQRTGLTWYLTLTGAGVQSLNGHLAPLVALGDYPVVSAGEAVGRLSDPRFGVLGGMSVLAGGAGRSAPESAGGLGPAAGERGSTPSGPAPSGPAPRESVPGEPGPGQPGPGQPAPDEPGSPPTTPPAPLPAGEGVPWPVEDVAITGARLGLAQYTTPDGAALLVPAYELSADDGRSWSVLAVAEDHLVTAP